MSRKLVAALACRVQGTRLYGKPLQNLEAGYTIIDHILRCIGETPEIAEAVLGISEGVENQPFIDIAKKHGAGHIIGDQTDVMWRLVQCGREGDATDVFRITTECPFTAWELLADAWARHVAEDLEISAVDCLAEGVGFELYRLDALERAHREGLESDRSEYVNCYPRENQHRFRIGVTKPAPPLDRMDVRLTVDYPEDLVLCREVYAALKDLGPRIPMDRIIEFYDSRPDLVALVAPYAVPGAVWDGVAQRGGRSA